MFLQPPRQLSIGLFAVVLTSLVGCGQSGFESNFVYSENTESLMKEAQNGFGEELPGVKTLIDQRFGNPQNLTAWSKLPIEFGGTAASVAAAPEEGIAVKELSLTVEDEIDLPEGETFELQFVTGPAAPEVVEVTGWSAKNSMASLSQAMEIPPAAGDVVVINGGQRLKHGRSLYMRHCSHCHGTSGDGKGPTAEYLTPRPRDYRHGVFKFTSTAAQSKASRDDIKRVLRNGVAGTYMPSFVPMLDEDELTTVVEYVRFLAMRGEFERKLATELSVDYSKEALESRREGGESRGDIVDELKTFMAEDLPDSLEFISDDLATVWDEANSEDALLVPSAPRVPDSEESRQKGRELYVSAAINCADCHGISGKGNGPQSTIFEKNPVTQQLYPEPGLHDVWDNVNQPRNLTHGIYRGGRRPIDLFCRIHAGIKGSRMPSFKNLKHEDIWHIVNYVLSIPFEPEPGHADIAVPAAPAAATTP